MPRVAALFHSLCTGESEAALRAAAVTCGQVLVEQLQSRSAGSTVSGMALDQYLWRLGQSDGYKQAVFVVTRDVERGAGIIVCV